MMVPQGCRQMTVTFRVFNPAAALVRVFIRSVVKFFPFFAVRACHPSASAKTLLFRSLL
jgi:hypothetical protein